MTSAPPTVDAVAESLPSEIHGAEVVEGSVPDRVDQPLYEWADLGAGVTVSRTQATCHVPGGGRFWVEGGRRVVVDAGAEDRPTPWLHATIGSLVLAQQGRFALHANVVDVGGRAIAVCGARRAGKSTSSLAMSVRGHRLVTDDVTTLDVEGDSVVHRPSGRPIHVHPATAERLGLSIEGAVPVAGDPTKVALANPASAPIPVAAIVLLRAVEREIAGVELTRLNLARSMPAVHRQAYRRGLLDAVWSGEIFAWAGAVADRVPVWLMVRSIENWTVDAVCDALERVAGQDPIR